MAKFGLGYDDLKEQFPVWCIAQSPFRPGGPFAQRGHSAKLRSQR